MEAQLHTVIDEEAIRTTPLRLAATVAVLVAVAVIVALWSRPVPSPFARRATPVVQLPPFDPGASSPARCVECGTVVLVREFALQAEDAFAVAVTAPHLYRVTVRMEDGTYRTLSQGVAPPWRPGDKVRLAGGTWVKP